MARPRCLYCGAALGAAALAAAETASRAARHDTLAASAARTLVLLDLTRGDASEIARRLGLSLYEARQRLARGGVQFQRVVPAADAAAESERLRGLAVILVPEDELRPALEPVPVQGGSFEAGVLELRAPHGPLRVQAQDVLGLVRGPITREYAAEGSGPRRRIASAGLEPGYRFHLHRHQGPPVELDAWGFEFRERDQGRSSLLTLTGWCLELAKGRPQDDGFRLEAPALSPSEQAADEAQRALGRSQRPKHAGVILDNLRQFRYYSGWRAACLRRANG